MTDSEITVSILREIRDSVRTLDTNLSTRIDVLNDSLSTRIDRLDERLTGRIDTLTDRVSLVEYAVKDAAAQVLLLTRYVKNKNEVEVADLRQRVTTLEHKVG